MSGHLTTPKRRAWFRRLLIFRALKISRYGVCFALALSVLSSPAFAGAWPRGEGKIFVSVAQERTADREMAEVDLYEKGQTSARFNAFYAEFGLTQNVTVGLDHGFGDSSGTRQTLSFVTLHLQPPSARVQVALDLGFGDREYPAQRYNRELPVHLRDIGIEQVYRGGLSLGMSGTIYDHNVWTALDLRQEHRKTFDETVSKADWTVGLVLKNGTKVFMQSQYSEYPGSDAKLRLAPSYVKQAAPEKYPALWLETGALYDLHGGDRVGMRVGLWWDF